MNLSVSKSKKYILVFFLISAVCFLAYSNSLSNPFIWDDRALVLDNTLIRSIRNLPASFTNDLYFGAASGSNFYRPLQTISYIFDYHFWQLDPLGYHLTNIILQIGVSFLVFLFIFELFKNFPVALASALFFTVSPIHTEAVTYISGRAEMLMGFFVILGILFFIRSQKKGLKNAFLFYLLSLFSFIAALLSKEVAVVFPLIICGYIFYFLREKLKEKHYLVITILPFFVLSALYLFLRLSLLHFLTLRPPALANISWFVRLSVLPQAILTYFKLLILPVGLHMNREMLRPISVVGIIIAVSALGTIIFASWRKLRYRQESGVASFMLFWSLVFFIPQSGIFPINAFVAEHFIYLSSISFFVLLAYILHKLLRKVLFILAVGLLTLFYIMLCAGRNFQWKEPLVFYRNIIKYSPNSFQARNNLGLRYEELGRFNEAEAEYKAALVLKPDLIEARSNLANLYFKLKLYEQAKTEYFLLGKNPLGVKAGEVRNNLGNIYEASGDLKEAVVKYNQALKLDPSLKFTRFNLARIYFSQGDMKEAAEQILGSLGESAGGKDAGQILDFLKIAGSVDNASQFYNNLGIYFAQKNLWDMSVSAFICALELDPKSSDYYYNLGLTYFGKGENSKAKNALKQALRINPNHIRAKRLIAVN